MGKKEIAERIAYYEGQTAVVSGKIAALEAARQTLQGTDTSVEYTLESHETIKATHHLAGTPYLEMTNAEEDIVSQMEKYFQDQKDFFLEEIASKISHYNLTLDSYSRSMTSLRNSLALAE